MTDTRIARLRRERGWTQERLAAESGLGVRTIQRLEAGSDASLQTLGLIAAALGVPVAGLFETPPPVTTPETPRRRVPSAALALLARGGRTVRAIRASIALVVGLALAGGAVGCVVAAIRPPVYQATARAYVDTDSSAFGRQVLESYASLATTPYLLRIVQAQVAVPEAVLGRAVSATVQPDAPVIAVTARASSPALAARIADAAVADLGRATSALTPTAGGSAGVHITPIARATATGVQGFVQGGLLGLCAGLVAGVVVAVLLALLRRRRPPGSGASVGRVAVA